MSERIKRYTIDALLSDPIIGSPRAYLREQYAPSGDWCRSTDVAAIEAENARLLRIVEAGEITVDGIVYGADMIRELRRIAFVPSPGRFRIDFIDNPGGGVAVESVPGWADMGTSAAANLAKGALMAVGIIGAGSNGDWTNTVDKRVDQGLKLAAYDAAKAQATQQGEKKT